MSVRQNLDSGISYVAKEFAMVLRSQNCISSSLSRMESM